MLNKLLCFYLAIFSGTLSAQCPPDGDINVSTQMALELLMEQYPECTVLNNVIIGQYPGDPADAVNSLLPLQNITTINGFITLDGTSQFTSLAGLENLTSVGLQFSISGTNLTDISALHNLTSIGSTLSIYGAPISSLAPLNNLTTLGGLDYNEQDNTLQEFMVLNYTNFDGTLIMRFTQDHDISGLGNLQTISGWLRIEGPITDISALSGITSVQELYLDTATASLEALGSLNHVSWALLLRCPNVSSLEPLGSLTHAGAVALSDMPLVTSLHGLEGLTAIQGDASPFGAGSLAINNLDGLNSLSGLQNINTLYGGKIYMVNNDALTDISALGSIDAETISEVTFYNNPALSVCNNPAICSYLQGSGPRDIALNAPGCDSAQEVLASCTTGSAAHMANQPVRIYPNPAANVLQIAASRQLTHISLYNSLGQTLPYTISDTITQINVQALPAGIYFCHITDTEGHTTIEKFTVAR